MRLLCVFMALFSFNSFATFYELRSFSHTDSGRDGFPGDYYSCRFAKDALDRHLEALGAINIRTGCTGGIVPGRMATPVSLRTTFEAPHGYQDFSRRQRVKISSASPLNGNCFFHTKILNKLLPTFPNVVVSAQRSVCAHSSSRWYYDLQVSL